MKKAFINSNILTEGRIIKDTVLLTIDNKIEGIVNNPSDLRGYKLIDLHGAYLCPGFIDLQIMGAAGALFGGNPGIEALGVMERHLLNEGVIGFLPTVSTNSPPVLNRALDSAVAYRKAAIGNFLGLHIEGPFINANNRGAHPIEFISKATIEELERLTLRASGEIKMLTIAPECQDQKVLEYLYNQPWITAMGHTGATYDEASKFLANKRKAVTHLFNGMPAMHHRSPGPIPAIFENQPYTSIVADGIHVDFRMIALAKRNLGEFLYLISDAATECSKGVYQNTEQVDRFVTLDKSGKEVLSGSKLTMMTAVRNCVEIVGIPLAEAVNMATLYPARALNIANTLGAIKSGYKASFIVFDKEYQIQQVFFNGKCVRV